MKEVVTDFKFEAERLICEHTEAMITGVIAEFNTTSELCDYMISECAWILTRKFLEGEYTPLEYNAIRNELTKIFEKKFSIESDYEIL